jgi:RNA polymerase sigma factor (sigma-70 family)
MTLYTQEELDVSPVDHDMHLLRLYALEASEWAFAEIVERHGKWIYGMCRRALHDRELAEDAVQAVFLTLSRKAAGMPEQTRLSGWLYRATKFAVADARKRERRYRRREEVARRLATERAERLEPAGISHPDGCEISLDNALGSLNERDRGVLLMHFYEGLTVRQIGDLLGLSREGAKKRVSRALARLRMKMGAKSAAAASMGSIVVAGMQAAVAETMPAALARTIVSTATGSAAGASVRGLGIAGAVIRAMMGTGSAASNLLRGTAAIKLAGATAVVAAGVLYYGPLHGISRAKTSNATVTTAVAGLRGDGSHDGSTSAAVNLAAVPLSSYEGTDGEAAAQDSSTERANVQPPGTVTVTGGGFRATRPVDVGLVRREEPLAAADPVVRAETARGNLSANVDMMVAAARASSSGGNSNAGSSDSADAGSQTAEPAAVRAANSAKPVDGNAETAAVAEAAAAPAAGNGTIDQSRAAAAAAAAAAMTSAQVPALTWGAQVGNQSAAQGTTSSGQINSSQAGACDSSGTGNSVATSGTASQSMAISPPGGIVIALNGNGLPGGPDGMGAYIPAQNGLAAQPVVQGYGLIIGQASDHRMGRGAGQAFGSGNYAVVQLAGNSPTAQTWIVTSGGGAVQYIDGPPAGMLTIGVTNLGLASNGAGSSEFAIPDAIRLAAGDDDLDTAGTLAAVGIESGSAFCGTLSGGNWGRSAGTVGGSDALTATTSTSGTGSCSVSGAADGVSGSGTGNWSGNDSGDWSARLATGPADGHWEDKPVLAEWWGSGFFFAHEALEPQDESAVAVPDLVSTPEPSSLLMGGIAIGLLTRRRRRIF